MLIKCNECDKEYSSQAKACVHCGAKNKGRPMSGGTKGVLVVVGLVVAFLGFGAVKSNTPEGREKGDARARIWACRDMQEDHLRSARERAAIKLGCDEMEREFRQKWGVKP